VLVRRSIVRVLAALSGGSLLVGGIAGAEGLCRILSASAGSRVASRMSTAIRGSVS
jgi:hypothetical protein